MKNYIQPGDVISVLAPAVKVSGQGVLVGSLFGYAVKDAASGAQLDIQVKGVVEAAKLSTDNMTVGAKVNYNDTNSELQLASSDLDGVGTVVEAAAASTTVVKVRLTPV